MPNIGAMLKQEIARVSRREIRSQVEPLRKASAQYRHANALLKQQVATLERQLAQLQRQVRNAPAATESEPQKLRFVAKGLKSHRARLGLSAADYGKLAELRLTLHTERAQVFPVKAGIPWLGFRVFPTHRRLKRSNVKTFIQRLRAQRDAYRAGEIGLGDVQQSLQAWIAHASHGNTYRLRRAIFRQVIF